MRSLQHQPPERPTANFGSLRSRHMHINMWTLTYTYKNKILYPTPSDLHFVTPLVRSSGYGHVMFDVIIIYYYYPPIHFIKIIAMNTSPMRLDNQHTPGHLSSGAARKGTEGFSGLLSVF